MSGPVAFLFDLDGTLVDSVYNHVRAWHLALGEAGIELSVWTLNLRKLLYVTTAVGFSVRIISGTITCSRSS